MPEYSGMLDRSERGAAHRKRTAVALALVMGMLVHPVPGTGAPRAPAAGAAPPALAQYAARYFAPARPPNPGDRVFWVPVVPAGNGVRFVTRREKEGPCALVFTSPIRLNEYMARNADLPSEARMAAWDAATCAAKLAEVAAQGVRGVLVDPSSCDDVPRRVLGRSLDWRVLLGAWVTSRDASMRECARRYRPLELAVRRGEFEHAGPELERLLGCVIPEEPRLSILLAACGVALANDAMTDDALRELAELEPACARVVRSEVARAAGRPAAERSAAARRILLALPRVTTRLLAR